MKKRLRFAILAILAAISLSSAALANMPTPQRAATAPVYVAMFFSKMTGRTPDFNSWARASETFKNTPPADRFVVEEAEAKHLQSIYSLLTMQEQLTVKVPVILSSYDSTRKGFFVTNFKDDTFFPVRYDGQSYGVVPQGIIDRQWLKVPDDATAAGIQAAIAAKGDKHLSMTVVMSPKYAEGTTPMVIDGESYWLISTEVSEMALYAPDGLAPLWVSNLETTDDKKRQEILQLRQ